MSQAPGEPKHWCIYACQAKDDGVAWSHVWQVDGYAEPMHYAHEANAALFTSESFSWQQTLNANLSNEEFARVDELAKSEPPLKAKNCKSVTENCQGRAIRVLLKLSQEGIVDHKAVVDLQQHMDPIN